MVVQSETNYTEADGENGTETDTPELSLYETRPGRNVLTEEGNTNGWIASDVTVDVLR